MSLAARGRMPGAPQVLSLLVDRWDPARGGLEAYAELLARGLAARGLPVEIVCGRALAPAPVPLRALGRDGLAFHRAIEREQAAGRLGIPLSFRHPGPVGGVFLPLGGLFVDALARRRAAEPRPLAWLRRLARACSPRTRALLARERAFFATAGTSSLVLAASARTAASVRTAFPGFRGRIVVTGLPVDGERFRPPTEDERNAARAELALPEKAEVLLWLGHDARRKGLGRALAATAVLREGGRDVRLLLAGRAARAPAGAPGHLRFLGPRGDVLPLLHAADALVHPSFDDNLALAVLEALASGLPVVTTEDDGAAELAATAAGSRVLARGASTATLAAACADALDAARRIDERSARRAVVAPHFVEPHLERIAALLAPFVATASRPAAADARP